MRKRFNPHAVEDWLVQAFLCGAVMLSVFFNVVGNVDAKWYLPGVFMALFGIFRVVIGIRDGNADIRSSYYRNNNEFYASTQRRMQQADNYIWVTYVRLIPPPGFNSAEANSYFQYGLHWARNHPDKELRRIIGAPASGGIHTWLVQHHRESKDISNYHVRIVPHEGLVDGINMAIMDDKIVFLALVAEGQKMTGHSLETREAVDSFREYYLRWWSVAEKFDDYIARTASPGKSTPSSAKTIELPKELR